MENMTSKSFNKGQKVFIKGQLYEIGSPGVVSNGDTWYEVFPVGPLNTGYVLSAIGPASFIDVVVFPERNDDIKIGCLVSGIESPQGSRFVCGVFKGYALEDPTREDSAVVGVVQPYDNSETFNVFPFSMSLEVEKEPDPENEVLKEKLIWLVKQDLEVASMYGYADDLKSVDKAEEEAAALIDYIERCGARELGSEDEANLHTVLSYVPDEPLRKWLKTVLGR